MTRADFTAALRQIAREPWPTCATVSILAIAIAAATSFFAVVDGVLLRPLPFHRSEELVAVSASLEITRRLTIEDSRTERIRMQGSALISGGALAEPAGVVDEMTALAEGTRHYAVSPNFFEVLGSLPFLGRALMEEDKDAEPRAAVISYAMWQSRFGGDPTVVGSVVQLEERRMQIQGVMPAGFEFPSGANVWSLLASPRERPPDFVRLSPGTTIGQFRAQFPRLDVVPLSQIARPREGIALAFLFAATVLVGVVVWVQVVSLQFARASGRARDIGIRLALGATHGRLLREFVAEGLLIALAGICLAWAAVPVLLATILHRLPSQILRGQHVAADGRTLAFACAFGALGVIAAVIVPHKILTRATPVEAFRGASLVGVSARQGTIRTALLFVQFATTAWLLYLAGLAAHSLIRVSAVDLGFDPSRVLIITLGVDRSAMMGLEERQVRLTQLTESLRSLPGVTATGHAFVRPLKPGKLGGTAWLPFLPAFAPMTVRVNVVSPQYFEALGVSLLEGRMFTDSDQQVAIVNETMARHLQAHGPVLGQFIQVTAQRGRIVGVVRDAVDERPDVASDPQVFFPDVTGIVNAMLVRVVGDPQATMPAVRDTARRVWGERRVEVSFMRDQLLAANAAYRGRATILGWLAGIGTGLSLIGLAGALMFAVRQRQRELAVRIALGAQPAAVQRLVLRWALTLVMGASLAGILTGAAIGRWGRSLLFDVAPLDLATCVGLLGFLCVTALVAAWVPAARAAHIDPAITLRD
jgi:putative ABC transport system permease protein